MDFNFIPDFFKGLTFEEDRHLYSFNNKALKLSVSGLIKRYVTKTDFYIISINEDKKNNLEKGSTNRLWKYNSEMACAIGTKAHYFGELYMFSRKLKPTTKLEEAIVKFYNDLPDHIVPVFPEIQMLHLKYFFGGTCDILLFNTKTKKYILADYKSNKDIFKNFRGKRLLPPFNNRLEDGFNKYTIQFSLYQILLEQVPGVKVERRVLVWLLPDGEYKLYDTDDVTDILKEELKKIYD